MKKHGTQIAFMITFAALLLTSGFAAARIEDSPSGAAIETILEAKPDSRPAASVALGLELEPLLTSSSSGSCATDGICNFECGSPYDWDCASLACNEPNVCGWTGGVCGPNEFCWVDICVCEGGIGGPGPN